MEEDATDERERSGFIRTDEEVAPHDMLELPILIPGFGCCSPNEVDRLVMPYRETGVFMGERPIEPVCMDLNPENLLAMGVMEMIHWQHLGSDDSFKAIHMSQPSKCNLISLGFDPTGCFLAAAFKDRVIRVYDLQAGRLCGRTAKLPLTEDLTALHWSGNLLAIGTMSGGLYLQDMKRSGRTVSCMEPNAGSTRWSQCQAHPRIRHTPPTMSLKWSRDGSQLASAVFGREIQVIDPRKSGLAVLFLDHPGIVNCMDWSPHHGRKLVSGGDPDMSLANEHGTLYLWDTCRGTCIEKRNTVPAQHMAALSGSVRGVCWMEEEDEVITLQSRQLGHPAIPCNSYHTQISVFTPDDLDRKQTMYTNLPVKRIFQVRGRHELFTHQIYRSDRGVEKQSFALWPLDLAPTLTHQLIHLV